MRISVNQLNKEAEGIIQRVPIFDYDVRTVTKVARMVLLNGSVWKNGCLYEPKSKSLGAGVYHIWYEEKYK
jgi:hypothetical protein